MKVGYEAVNGLIVFRSLGRLTTSVLGIEARCIPRPFCLCLGSRASPLSSILLSALTWEHTSSSSLSAPARKQKKQKCEAMMIHLANPRSRSFCVGKPASAEESGYPFTYDLASIKHSTLWPGRVIETSSHPPVLSASSLYYSHLRSISYFAT